MMGACKFMTREKLQQFVDDLSDTSPVNYVGPELDGVEEKSFNKHNPKFSDGTADADYDGLLGMRFYEKPIFSIARADAPGFMEIKRPDVVGEHHMLPRDWLPEAKTVVSFALPVSRRIVESNKINPLEPSIEWLYSRIEGNRFLLALGAAVRDALISDGHKAVTPYLDDRFVSRVGTATPAPGAEHLPPFSSTWSERHIGVVTGLGTFGLSTNFISKAGSTVRLISVVTDWDIAPDERDYDNWLGYCNRCGVCISRCPANAHYDDKPGKDHTACSMYIRKVSANHSPRYGCGKCQTGTPCEYLPMNLKSHQ